MSQQDSDKTTRQDSDASFWNLLIFNAQEGHICVNTQNVLEFDTQP